MSYRQNALPCAKNTMAPPPACKPLASDCDSVLWPLLSAVRQGCHASFERLLTLTRRRLQGIVQRILNNASDTQDVLQETYLKVWQRCHDFDQGRGRVMVWLSAMARHAAIDDLRRRSARPWVGAWQPPGDEDPCAELPAAGPGPSDCLYARQCTLAVQLAQRGLVANQREVLSLTFGEGLSQSEIAARLNRPLGTVKAWVSRSFSLLRPLLVDHR